MFLSYGKQYHNTFKCFYPTANNTITRMQIVLIKHSSPQSFDFVTWPPDILCWVDWNENPEVKVWKLPDILCWVDWKENPEF